MFWPDDNEWYTADVIEYDAETKQHRLWWVLWITQHPLREGMDGEGEADKNRI